MMTLRMYSAPTASGHVATYYEDTETDTVLFGKWEDGSLMTQTAISDWWTTVMRTDPIGTIEMQEDDIPEIPDEEEEDKPMMYKNHEDLVNKLDKALRVVYGECRKTETQFYLYDNEDGTAELREYEFAGCNSWMEGENLHWIKTVAPTYDDALDNVVGQWGLAELPGVLDMTMDQLVEKAREYCRYDEDDEVGVSEIEQYIRSESDLMDIVERAYLDWAVEEMDCEEEARLALEEEDE